MKTHSASDSLLCLKCNPIHVYSAVSSVTFSGTYYQVVYRIAAFCFAKDQFSSCCVCPNLRAQSYDCLVLPEFVFQQHRGFLASQSQASCTYCCLKGTLDSTWRGSSQSLHLCRLEQHSCESCLILYSGASLGGTTHTRWCSQGEMCTGGLLHPKNHLHDGVQYHIMS